MEKNKIFIIAIIVLLTLVIGFVLAFSFKCKNSETGWQCQIFSSLGLIVDSYKNKCETQGGYWRCESHHGKCNFFGLGGIYYCDFPYDDAGKSCSESSECKGLCVVSEEYVRTNYPNIKKEDCTDFPCGNACLGACTKYVLRNCEHPLFKIENGEIKNYTCLFCE